MSKELDGILRSAYPIEEPITEIRLFGSFSKGLQKSSSDIDFLIIFNENYNFEDISTSALLKDKQKLVENLRKDIAEILDTDRELEIVGLYELRFMEHRKTILDSSIKLKNKKRYLFL